MNSLEMKDTDSLLGSTGVKVLARMIIPAIYVWVPREHFTDPIQEVPSQKSIGAVTKISQYTLFVQWGWGVDHMPRFS